MRRRFIILLLCGLFGGLGKALFADGTPPRHPGVLIEIYDVSQDMDRIRALEDKQKPDVARIFPKVDLLDKRGDFAPYTEQYITSVSGFLNIDVPGKYVFKLRSDDGSILWIDETMVANDDGLHSANTTAMGALDLIRGEHPFLIRHFQNYGDSQLTLEWEPPGAKDFSVVPEKIFTTTSTIPPTADGPKFLKPLSKCEPLKLPEGLHPSYYIYNLCPTGFEPKVTGLDFQADGRLMLGTWNRDGGIYAIRGVTGDHPDPVVRLYTKDIIQSLGLKVEDGETFVMQRNVLSGLIDQGEGFPRIDESLRHWSVGDTLSARKLVFGLTYSKGWFYGAFGLILGPDGRILRPQNPVNGQVFRISAEGKMEFVASGFRAPNGMGVGPDGEVLITDNHGEWVPASKLVVLEPGAFYGAHADPAGELEGVTPETPPVVWLPTGEAGNSPSQPACFPSGPYAGQILLGDVTYGGLQRVFMEKVNGIWQGAVFRFTQGLEAGVNRICFGPDGDIYLGEIGIDGWSQPGKKTFGLQKLSYTGRPTFEMKAIRILRAGFEIEFTEPLDKGQGEKPQDYDIEQWFYLPAGDVQGKKMGLAKTPVTEVKISPDRTKVLLYLSDLRQGDVVHFKLNPQLVSEGGRTLWSNEAWYTLNSIPYYSHPDPARKINTLTEQEKSEGWKLLFDGRRTTGWHGSKTKGFPSNWIVQNGALCCREEGENLLTDDQYGNFELKMDWKVAPEGAGRICYRVNDPSLEKVLSMSIVDNLRRMDGWNDKTAAGSLYGILPPIKSVAYPAGSWNEIQIIAQGSKIEHWMNGVRILSTDFDSAKWIEWLARNQITKIPAYTKIRDGVIRLEDCGGVAWFRNIKIRKLPAVEL